MPKGSPNCGGNKLPFQKLNLRYVMTFLELEQWQIGPVLGTFFPSGLRNRCCRKEAGPPLAKGTISLE